MSKKNKKINIILMIIVSILSIAIITLGTTIISKLSNKNNSSSVNKIKEASIQKYSSTCDIEIESKENHIIIYSKTKKESCNFLKIIDIKSKTVTIFEY